ncbi:MAG: hypothetical protein RL571_2698 [Pseudomonadota bacterium]|jgi:hypothetical protein
MKPNPAVERVGHKLRLWFPEGNTEGNNWGQSQVKSAFFKTYGSGLTFDMTYSI